MIVKNEQSFIKRIFVPRPQYQVAIGQLGTNSLFLKKKTRKIFKKSYKNMLISLPITILFKSLTQFVLSSTHPLCSFFSNNFVFIAVF